MYLKKSSRKGGRTYLSIAYNYREDGRSKTKTVASLGYVDELELVYENPIAYFTDMANRLGKQRHDDIAKMSLEFSPSEQIGHRESRMLLGDAVIARYYEGILGLAAFWANRKKRHHFTYDANAVFRLLVKCRLLFGDSLTEAHERKGSFFEKSDFSLEGAYRALPFFVEHGDALIAHMRKHTEGIAGKGKGEGAHERADGCSYTYCFAYDAVAGLNANEVGKESWKHPVACIGVSLGKGGIPCAFKVDLSARGAMPALSADALETLKAETGVKRTIAISESADGNPVYRQTHGSSARREGTRKGKAFRDGFIHALPLENASDGLAEWIAAQDGYSGDGMRVKSRVVALASGADAMQVAFWDESHAWADASARAALHDRHGDGGGDPGIIGALDGYRCLITSETKMAAHEVVTAYLDFVQAKSLFSSCNRDFRERPVRIPYDQYLQAGFLVGYTALVTLRMMQAAIGWRYTASRIIEALRSVEGTPLKENWYLFDYRTDTTDALAEAAGIDLSKRFMSQAAIRKVLAKAKRG